MENDPLRRFVEDPLRSAVFTDFDGTLSDIVDHPDDARPRDEVPALLSDLAARYALVGVLSGRPLHFLDRFSFDPAVSLVGIYGLEQRHGGVRADHPESGVWREVVVDVLAAAGASGPPGMKTEGKGLSVTVHYRQAPEQAAAVERWARTQAARTGLELRTARKSFELHPPIRADKGTVVLALVAAASAPITNVCFLGDDVGDLPAFDALDDLGRQGLHTVRVVASSDETDAELLGRADLVVDGPPGCVDVLRRLLG